MLIQTLINKLQELQGYTDEVLVSGEGCCLKEILDVEVNMFEGCVYNLIIRTEE